MKEIGPYLCEVMFALSVEDDDIETLKVTGAHFKTNSYVVRDDGSTFGHNMSSAQSIDLANEEELNLMNPLNGAIINELNKLKVSHSQLIESLDKLNKDNEDLFKLNEDLSNDRLLINQELDGVNILLEKANVQIESLKSTNLQFEEVENSLLEENQKLDELNNSLILKIQELEYQIESLTNASEE